MHPEAYQFVKRMARGLGPRRRVVELGSYDVNGSARDFFPDVPYVGLDLRPGPGVDVVCDAAEYRDDAAFDTAVCMETLEHTPRGADLVLSAYRLLDYGGVLLITCATDPRAPHGVNGCDLRPGEYYGNVRPESLRAWLSVFAFRLVDGGEHEGDLYALAVKL